MVEFNDRGFYELSRAKSLSDVDVIETNGTSKHFHPQVEILVVVDGVFRVSINNTERLMPKGSVCIADSFDTHAYQMVEKGLGYVLIVPKNSMLSEYNSVAKNMIFKDNFLFDEESFGIIKELVLTLYQSLNRFGRLYNKGIALAVMGILFKKLPLEKRTDSDKVFLMKDVLEYIHDNLNQELSLASLAKRFGYTPNHFSLIFRKFAKCKLNAYLNSVRLEKGISLMLENRTILDCAMLAGFDSIRTFYRVFNDNYKMSPTAYLKQFDKTE